MAIENEYRREAERCRVQAERASKSADRVFWLMLAQNWQTLAQQSGRQPEPKSKTMNAD
jgi:hypothetical protein